jgi:hypothetical protein
MFTMLAILGGYLIFVGLVVAFGRAVARDRVVLGPLSGQDVASPSEGSPKPPMRAPLAVSSSAARRTGRAGTGATVAS